MIIIVKHITYIVGVNGKGRGLYKSVADEVGENGQKGVILVGVPLLSYSPIYTSSLPFPSIPLPFHLPCPLSRVIDIKYISYVITYLLYLQYCQN